MKIAVVAPSPSPYTRGGAERLWSGLASFIDEATPHQAEVIKLPVRESHLPALVAEYRAFWELDVSSFDLVISGKYPAWLARHERHVCYMLHRLRGLYEQYPAEADRRLRPLVTREVDDLLGFLERWRGRPEAVAECFERLEAIGSSSLPVDLLAVLSPLTRAVVRFLDDAALSEASIHRYLAISRTVARRRGYLPAGAEVEVIHPPSSLAGLSAEPLGDYFFTVSRLDPQKRLDLLVEAWRCLDDDVELRIGGEGPQRSSLERLAGGDPRIVFLGPLTDRELAVQYSGCFAVPFVPLDEDFGLVTLEAMTAGKPVLTTTDAGGPLELVDHDVNGVVATARPDSVADAVRWLVRHREKAAQFGRMAAARAASVNWEPLAGALLSDGTRPRRYAPSGPRPGRPLKLTVATTFGVFPPRNGGQKRVFELYRRLAAHAEVRVVTLGNPSTPALTDEIAPRLWELRTPATGAFAEAEAELSRALGNLPATDLAFLLHHELLPAYSQTLSDAARGSDVVIACHPYVFPAINLASSRPMWLDAQDVESDLKADVLPRNGCGEELLEKIREAERACCSEATKVMVCSDADGRRLQDLYAACPERFLTVPNGVDVARVPYRGPLERYGARAPGSPPICLFLGSWHPPNLRAVERLIDLADRLPSLGFVTAGSCTIPFRHHQTGPNHRLLGTIDDSVKDALLDAAHLALNPMESGSGTNLKLLEYLAAGLPVVSTPHGLRGLEIQGQRHLRVADVEDFGQAIAEVLASLDRADRMAAEAREVVSQLYDWEVIARQLARSVL